MNEAFRSLRHNFFQTILSVLGIIIGVGALVTMLALIDGLEKLARAGLAESTSMESVVVTTSDKMRRDGVVVSKQKALRLTPGVIDSLMDFLPFPATAELTTSGTTLLALPDTGAAVGLRYLATTLPLYTTPELAIGRSPTPADTKADASATLINYALARRLVGAQDTIASALGKQLSILGRTYSVVGVTQRDEQDVMVAVLPLAAFLSDSTAEGHRLTAQLHFERVEDIRSAVDTMEAYFAATYPDIEEPARVMANLTILERIEISFTIFRLVMSFLIGIAVVVGGVGVMNVLLMAIKERTSEIGVRKAMGATRRRIMRQFLGESIAISFIGSILGLVLGMLAAVVIAFIITKYFEDAITFEAVFTLRTLLTVTLVALLTGITFGTYPARRAARLDPVEAIRG